MSPPGTENLARPPREPPAGPPASPGGAAVPSFHGILFPPSESAEERPAAPASSALHDLNLDQVFRSALDGRDEYDLAPLFSTPLTSVDAVRFRHEVLRDLDAPRWRPSVEAFGREMRSVRKHLGQVEKLYYPYPKAGWFLDAAEAYCRGVRELLERWSADPPTARGLASFHEYLRAYAASEAFRSLDAESRRLKADLGAVTYSLLLRGSRIAVREYREEPDYSAQVLATFQRFQRDAAKDYRVTFAEYPEMNHVEAAVLDRVANLRPELFRALAEFPERHHDFFDPGVRRFERESQFYLAYLERIDPLRAAGLRFCYPEVSDRSKAVSARETFDLALAQKLVKERAEVVRNDFSLAGEERIVVVSGPNQGGKTTFARTFGQLHSLARLGLPVPGEEAHLYLCDAVYTHFEKEERIENLRGKLQDELVRLHDILGRATDRSVIVVNESFTTTTVRDALFLGRQVLARVGALGALCVYVTFIDELSTVGPSVVSMVSTVAPDDPTRRTFKVVRRVADGKAYALAIARKYGLTYDDLRGRLGR